MNTWFKLLPLELQEVSELLEPTEEVERGETVIGVVSEELKKLYTLWQSLRKSAELLEIELKYRKSTNAELGKISELRAKARALGYLFWIGACDELQLWGNPGQSGVRAGWQVVEFKKPESPFDFLFRGKED